jgi:hypothetical protein
MNFAIFKVKQGVPKRATYSGVESSTAAMTLPKDDM